MRTPRTLLRDLLFLGMFAVGNVLRAAPEPTAAGALPEKWTDVLGNNYRRAAQTGHVTNYDETKVGPYTLPDPLVLNSGAPVSDRNTWQRQRRAEIVELYRHEVYGRVPSNAPRVSFEVTETDFQAVNGLAIRKLVAAHFAAESAGPGVKLHLYLPRNAKGRVPVLLHLLFGNPPLLSAEINNGASAKASEVGPIAEFLKRGYGYAFFRYTEIEPDGETSRLGVRLLAGSRRESPDGGDDWGSISAWAWGASRMLDYLEQDPAIDGSRIGLIGHSRLGKTVLWAGAQDERFALVFSSCAGEMGSSLARRDYGETVDDMATNFGHQFAGNFKRYIGHWSELPIDAHLLITLIAPRPVLITGGTQDQWADPRGEFLAELAAAPVYRLLGKKDLGTTEFPPADNPLVTGELGFYYHTGAHAILPSDWSVFLEFAGRYLKPGKAEGDL